MGPEEARYAALRNFGGVDQVKEEVPGSAGTRFIEEFWQDLRYGLRMLRKSPGFTAVAVLTLTLSVGANTAIFSLIEAVILRLLPVPHPEELYAVQTDKSEDSSFSYPLYQRLKDALPAGAQLAAVTQSRGCQVSLAGSLTEAASFQLVSGGYFSTLGVRPALGRLFTDEDDGVIGDHPIAVMGHAYWTRRWAQKTDVLGSVVHLNGQALTIIGVTGPGFTGTVTGDSTDFWVPARCSGTCATSTMSVLLVQPTRPNPGYRRRMSSG